ncbi:MAG: hypothetical protein ACFFDH_19045 [Promethearchaeota archaeon]
MRFNRTDCTADVGLKCGEFGKIAMEIKVENIKKPSQKKINFGNPDK